MKGFNFPHKGIKTGTHVSWGIRRRLVCFSDSFLHIIIVACVALYSNPYFVFLHVLLSIDSRIHLCGAVGPKSGQPIKILCGI